jgi:hypothetical protein
MRVERIEDQDQSQPCPIAWIDNFAMRDSTNECGLRRHAANGVGVMEAGYRVPVAVTELRWKTGSDAEDI